jgi:hypothetical protein
MFVGWHDPDKKTSTRAKVAAALVRYIEKFDDTPTMLMCNPSDWEQHEQERAKGIGGAQPLNLTVKTVHFIPRHTFYVGVEETR